MPKHILGKNSRVTINGTDLSSWAQSVNVEDTAEEVDVTGLGEDYREYIPGLKDAVCTITFFQDYDAGKVDAVVGGMYYSGTAGTVKINPDTSGTIVYTLISKVYGWPPVGGAAGDANTVDVTFRNSGTLGLTRGTA